MPIFFKQLLSKIILLHQPKIIFRSLVAHHKYGGNSGTISVEKFSRGIYFLKLETEIKSPKYLGLPGWR